jgi:ADP-heptose:LPS heptosyltransferase
MPKLLFIRFSSIGDIVLTSHTIRNAKLQIAEVEIHFLTKETFASILTANPYISRVFSIQQTPAEVLPQLKAEKYDAIIDLHNNVRSWRVKKGLGIKSFSFNKLNIEKWMLVNFKTNRLPDVHIVDRYLATLAEYGVKDDGLGLDYFIPPGVEIEKSALPETHSNGYVAFVIGGSYNTKMLPIEKAVSVCRKINKPVLLLGGPDDRQRGSEMVLRSGRHVWNACGLFTLHQSALLVKNSACVIAHDTGLMHIAAAFGKPVLSVWGNTVPEFGMYPYRPGIGSKKMEIKNLPCRPCSKLGFSKCPKKHFYCMELQDTDEMAAWGNDI